MEKKTKGRFKQKYMTLRMRIPILMLFGMLLIGGAIISVSYYKYEKINIEKHITMANGLTELMIKKLDTEKIDDYIQYNYSMEEYNEILKTYYTLKDSYMDVTFLYVYRFYKDANDQARATVVIDLDEEYTTNVPQSNIDWIGEVYVADDVFAKDIDDMLTQRHAIWHIVNARIEDGEVGKRLLTYAKPVFNDDGEYVCSVCVDFSLDDMYGKGISFIMDMLVIVTIFSSFILFYISYQLGKILFRPVSQLTKTITSFKYETDDDRFNNVRRLEDLNLQAGNELDDLYHALLLSTKDSAYYMASFNRTQNELKEVNEVVSKDALTHVRSKSAYQSYIEEIDKSIAKGHHKYAVIMADINNLKYVNDTFGHRYGDEYIKSCAHLICVGFKHSPVFRIGGDEFVIILTDESYDNKEELLKQIQKTFDEQYNDTSRKVYERYSASFGMAAFDPQKDHMYTDMFVRADHNMYNAKKQFKEQNGSYR